MHSLFDPSALPALCERLHRLTPESRARWGRMNVHRMLCHVADQLRCSLGDAPTVRRWTPLRISALRMLFVHLMPWPKGLLPTVPEFQRATPAEWAADVAVVEELLRRAAARDDSTVWPEHPAFGTLAHREWGWLLYKHTDHHLRQFGV